MAAFGTDIAFQAWLDARGMTLPAGAPALAILRQNGTDYINANYGWRFAGQPADINQDNSWPRTGAAIFGSSLASDVIPNRVVEASYRAAVLAATNPSSLSVVIDPSAQVKRSKVEGLEEEYFEPGARAMGFLTASVSSDIEGLLAPLLMPAMGLPDILVV